MHNLEFDVMKSSYGVAIRLAFEYLLNTLILLLAKARSLVR